MIIMSAFEWDLRKNRSNFEKHGITFEEASEIFESPVLIMADDRHIYGEDRLIGIGLIVQTVVIVMVFVMRKEVIRIISARKANSKERKKYYDYLEKAA